MRISARNQLTGTIVSIVRGPVMALVKLDVGGQSVSATLTAEAAEELGLVEGKQVVALFKSSAVLIGVE
jgi:molybdate transport system regulatory protein